MLFQAGARHRRVCVGRPQGGGGGGTVQNVEQAKTRLGEINEMFKDPKSPLMDSSHKDHDKVSKERLDLFEYINKPQV